MWRGLPAILTTSDRSELIERLNRMIPKQDTVQATPRLAAHFWDRDRVYPLHVEAPNGPDWIVVDLDDHFAAPSNGHQPREFLNHTVAAGRYDLAFQDASVYVLRRRR